MEIQSAPRQETDHMIKYQVNTMANDLQQLKSKYEEVERSLKVAVVVASAEITTKESIVESPAANFALVELGASIVPMYTSSSGRPDDWVISTVRKVASLSKSKRYSGIFREYKDASIVLDEHKIRGPGDCYTIKGRGGNITIDLHTPIIIQSVEVENIRPELESNWHVLPVKFRVFTQKYDPDFRTTNSVPNNDRGEKLIDYPRIVSGRLNLESQTERSRR